MEGTSGKQSVCWHMEVRERRKPLISGEPKAWFSPRRLPGAAARAGRKKVMAGSGPAMTKVEARSGG
jgi:hypothetical protein